MLIITHDNNSETLKDIRKETSIEKIHELATAKGLTASHTFDFSWIALAETPTGEDIFIARKCDTVTFKDKEYPVRTFEVIIGDVEQRIMVAPQSLSDAMGDDKEDESTEASDLDNEIYFYVLDEHIGLDGKEICENHLDEKMEFVEETE